MADVKSGLRTLQQPSTGDRNNIIDVVAIHGLNGTSTSTWVPRPNSATDLVSALFDDRSSDVRFSVYDWNLRTNPVDAFVLNDLREWCLKFLGDLTSLRQGDHQSYPIVLLGHDLGATLIKETLSLSIFDELKFRTLASSIIGLVSLGNTDLLHDNEVTQGFFLNLFQETGDVRMSESQQIQPLAVALSRVVVSVNFRFDQARRQTNLKFICKILSKVGDLKKQVFGEDLYMQALIYTSNLPHVELPRDGDLFKVVAEAMALWLLPNVEESRPILDNVDNTGRAHQLRSSPDTGLNFRSQRDAENLQSWASGSLQTRLHAIVHSEMDAEQVSSFAHAQPLTSQFRFTFWFRPWDSRRNTVESCLSAFLSRVRQRHRGDFKKPSLLAAECLDEIMLWTPESLFLRVYEVLRELSGSQDAVFWILANLSEEIESYHWFMAQLDALKVDSDLNIHIMTIATVPPSSVHLSPLPIIELAEQWSIPVIGDATAAERQDPADIAEPITQDVVEPHSANLPEEVMHLLIKSPDFMPISGTLGRLFNEYKVDAVVRGVLSRWILAKAARVNITELEQKALRFLSDPACVDHIFEEILIPALSGTNRDEQAVWVIELLLYGFRPFSIYEVEELNTLTAFPKLGISRDDVFVPGLFGLVEVFDQEIRFGHKHLRRFLSKQDENSSLQFGSKQRASRAHHHIAKACLEYLLAHTSEMSDLASRDLTTFRISESSVTFLSYAVRRWPEHAKSAGECFTEDTKLLERVVQDMDMLNAWAKIHWGLSNPITRTNSASISPIVLLAAYGLDSAFGSAGLGLEQLPFDAQLDTLELAARANLHTLCRRLISQPALKVFSSQRVILAAMDSRNEELVLAILAWAGEATSDRIGIPSALERAAYFGLTRVLESLIAQRENVDWSSLLASACIGGHLGSVELVVKSMQKLRRGLIINDGDQSSEISMPGLEVACKNGRSDVVAFFVTQHSQELFDGSQGMALFKKLIKLAANSGQAACLGVLLSKAKTLENGGCLEMLVSCFEESASRTMLRSCQVLFDHIATIVETEQRRRLVELHLVAAAEVGALPVIRHVLSIAASPNQPHSKTWSLMWDAVSNSQSITTDLKRELYRLVAEDHLGAWAAEDRDAKLRWQGVFSAYNDEPKVLSLLVDLGVDMDKQLKPYDTPLCYAAQRGHLACVRILLKGGADINLPSHRREFLTYNPLWLSCPHPKVVKVLVEAGADVNWKNNAGETALFNAARVKSLDPIRILLENGAEVNVRAGHGTTELSTAITSGELDVVRILLDAGADPLRYPAKELDWGLLHRCVSESLLDISRVLLVYNMPMDDQDDVGDTPLLSISTNTGVELVKLLVNRGANIEFKKEHGFTPLTRAVDVGNLDVVRYLIGTAGANVNATAGRGSPLYVACRNMSADMVQLLVENNADVNMSRPPWERTPFQCACLARRRRRLENSNNSAVLGYFLDLDKLDVNGESAWWGVNLNVACLTTDLEVIDRLISRGARVSEQDRIGRQPIHFAALRTVANLERLVEAGASIDAVDHMQRTILHTGVMSGNLDVVRYIIEQRPAFVNQPDADGWTPLLWSLFDCAKWNGENRERADIIRQLLQCGASRIVEGEGLDRTWTAYKLSHYFGLGPEIVKLVTPTEEELDSVEERKRKLWQYSLRSDQDKRKALKADIDAFCDACLAFPYGTRYICDVEPNFWLCFKCYRSKNVIHDPDHDFHEGGNEYQDSGDDNDKVDGSSPRNDEDSSDTIASESSHEKSDNDDDDDDGGSKKESGVGEEGDDNANDGDET